MDTKITFKDEHLSIIYRALEVYSRLRMGQIGIAMDEAFPDYHLTWDERESIEDLVKSIIFPDPPVLKYDGHGGYYDQYNNTYDENGVIDVPDWAQKCREKRPRNYGKNAYYGIFSDVAKEGDATLAYEVSQTIRQYLSIRDNDGYTGFGTNFNDPLHMTEIPLPIVEGFSKEKKFTIKGKSIVGKIQKAEENKDWEQMWDIVTTHLKNKHPMLDGWSQAKIEKDGNSYIIHVENARKKSI